MREYIFLISIFLYSAAANSAVYNFDVLYNGVSQTELATQDTIAGTALNINDGFMLDISTESGYAWTASGFAGIYASLLILDPGNRTGNSIATFLLNGLVVGVDTDEPVVQFNVHVGAQVYNFGAGLTFDQIVVDYTLLASTVGSNVLLPGAVHFNKFGDWNYAKEQVPPTVPEPSLLALLAISLVGMGYSRRSRAKAISRR